jgi:fatty acid desaturase
MEKESFSEHREQSNSSGLSALNKFNLSDDAANWNVPSEQTGTTSGQDFPSALVSKSVADLHKMRAAPGFIRFFSTVIPFLLFIVLSWQFSLSDVWFYIAGTLAGVFFAATAVTTHDAIHNTLTGIKWFDEISARLVTWPVLWPHGVYSEVHKLHHKMNGVDLRDPERVTFTEAEYNSAHSVVRFFMRHKMVLALFLGGLGMIATHVYRAFGFYSQSRAVRRQLIIDLVGIICVNGIIYVAAAAQGQLLKAFLLYVLVERIGGGILQFRAHIEHYGLSGKRVNFYATQLYTCRNITTNPWMSWLMNGLNFHSIHHAFPKIPFYNLKEATQRVDDVLKQNNAESLPSADGYLRTYIELSRELKLIKS